MNQRDYQKAQLILESACAALAQRLAQFVVDNGDDIANQAIGGEYSYSTEQLADMTEQLRQHTLALIGLHDWEHIWAPQRVVIVTTDPSGVQYEERNE